MLRQNVFARAEQAHLQHAGGNFKRRKIGWALLACNLIFAVLPFLATDHYADIPFHTLVGLCLIGFCLGYEFHIITLAINSIEHERQNRTWDSLVLTGVHGNRVIIGKWLALMRHSFGTALLLTISKLAIAYSIMQYLNIFPGWVDEAIETWNRSFIYMSYTNYAATTPIAYYPQLWQVIVTFGILVMLCLAEIALLVGLGMLTAFIKPHWLPVKLVLVGFLRIILCGLGLILVVMLGNLERESHRSHHYMNGDTTAVYWGCDSEFFRKQTDYYKWCVVERDHRRIFETAQVSASALADNGVLLAANIMRPIGSFPFAIRNTLSAFITAILMILLTTLSLLIASKFVQKRV